MRKLLHDTGSGLIANVIQLSDRPGARVLTQVEADAILADPQDQLAADDYVVPSGHAVLDDAPQVSPGWTFDGVDFIPPPEPVPTPQELRREVLKTTLRGRGATLDEIQEFLADHLGD